MKRPSFGGTCPSDIRRYADKAKNFTTVNWPTVVATDNSGLVPTVISSGWSNIYYEGRHEVVYNASDAAGNYRICKFHVTIESKIFKIKAVTVKTNFEKCGHCIAFY